MGSGFPTRCRMLKLYKNSVLVKVKQDKLEKGATAKKEDAVDTQHILPLISDPSSEVKCPGCST